MNLQIRRATPAEAETLTTIAHAAKRHWGYPEKWIQQWRDDLTLTREFIAGHEVYVAIVESRIAGCCALVLTGSLAEIEHMWIDPEQMGAGLGRALFEHVTERARQLGFNELELSADPNAEGFYQRMGAERIGDVRSEIDGQSRILPRMRVDVNRNRSA